MALGLLCLPPALLPPPAAQTPAAVAPPVEKKTSAAAAPMRRPWTTHRLVGLFLILAGCCILPWIAALALDPPLLVEPSKWNDLWIGVDACEAVGLLSTGLLLRRGDPRMRIAAAATAILLFADACFDLSTATPTERPLSILMAALAEVPIGALCVFLALRGHSAQVRSAGADVRDQTTDVKV